MTDFMIGPIQGAIKRGIQVIALNELDVVAITGKKGQQFVVAHGAINSGIGDFVAIDVYDGQNGAGFGGVEEFVAMPGSGGRACLCLAIPYDAGDNEVWIIHRCAERGGEGVAKFSPFMDGAGDAGIEMAGETAGPGKTTHELFKPFPTEG